MGSPAANPFIVAVNCFEGAQLFELGEVQMALNLGEKVPVVLCDARDKESCKDVLITLVQHAMRRRVGTAHPVGS